MPGKYVATICLEADVSMFKVIVDYKVTVENYIMAL